MNTLTIIMQFVNVLLLMDDNMGGCGSVASVLDFESGDSKFESHCSQHVVVGPGQDTSPQIAPVGIVHSTECM